MSLIIRKATAEDATEWLRLLKESLGSDKIAEQVYDLDRVGNQLTGPQVEETWVAEMGGKLRGSISILGAGTVNNNPVANLGRYLTLPKNYEDGTAEALIRAISDVCTERSQIAVVRVPASDDAQQKLLEKLGYVCVGFQPMKHRCMVREGILYYVSVGEPVWVARPPLSRSLPQIVQLASEVLKDLQLPALEVARDGLTGYPLQTDLQIQEATPADFESCKLLAQPSSPPVEISGRFNRGAGVLRVDTGTPMRAFLGRHEGSIAGGLCCQLDDHDKCMRLVDSFATDDLSMGALIRHAANVAQENSNALYVEADFLITSPRVLKTAEQAGFVPVAYLPGFFNSNGQGVDVVKMVKLNAMYSLDNARLTAHARKMVDIIDRNFQDQKMGVAVVKLLRALPIFDGLGDGQLGRMASLFTQKLYRANEKVFSKGDSSSEAYIVMRGQIDVRLEENGKSLDSIGAGAIIGEQAFLAGSTRNAFAIAVQPSILLVIQRPAFNALIQSEPHLGLVVMRNIATEVSNKLRKMNAAIPPEVK